MREKLHQTSLRLEPELLARTREIASEEQRPVANTLRLLLQIGIRSFEAQDHDRGAHQ
jgi:hypothetical protein